MTLQSKALTLLLAFLCMQISLAYPSNMPKQSLRLEKAAWNKTQRRETKRRKKAIQNQIRKKRLLRQPRKNIRSFHLK